jgi:nodulation protein E
MQRVVITGAGTVNPLGHDVPSTYAALARGMTAIGPLILPDVDRLQVRIGAQVTGWQGEFDRADLVWMDPFAQFAVASARQAMAQAGLGPVPQAGVILGSAGGGLQTVDDNYRAVPRLMASAGASLIARDLGLAGPSFTVASACSSSNHAIGQAVQMIRAGVAPVMLAGGSDAMLCFGGIKAWEGLRVLSPTACRPFSAGRDGMVMGEGAAVFVLEARDHARARGAQVLAEIAGVSMTTDAGDMVQPTVAGPVRAMALALKDAGMTPDEVGYINAHGTGTQANDRCEAAAIAQVFQSDVLVSATKSLHGHLIGGAGAVELLACLMALQSGAIAPTAGFLGPDADCPVNLVTKTRTAAVTAVLSNSFAFGGLNAVLALQAG